LLTRWHARSVATPLRRARAGAPAWSRPALIAVAALAGASMLIDVTRSGYGNTYYAAGALAASHSWSAMLTNAADLGGYVSLDKGPLPDWLMGLSGRLVGFGSFSVMVPGALCGIATVLVLHDAVRRALGHEVAILAALFMTLTPVAVLVGRYNAPDALLLLTLVAAAWSLTVAVQTGRVRMLALCAAFVGLGFNAKMLEAYLVVPALALAYLVAARGSLRGRARELVLAAGMTLLVSLAWFTSMTLIPAGERPYVGDSTDNSWFQLIFGGNGIERVSGSAGAFGRRLDSNVSYLFGDRLAGQVSWLLPLALVGLVLGLRATWSSRRTTFAFGAYVLWGAWALVGCFVLSFSAGTRHAYYTSILAPAVATLAAAALVTLWRAARAAPVAAIALAGAVAGSALISFAVLSGSPTFLPWLRWVVLAAGVLAGATVLAPRSHTALGARARQALALGAAAVALLAGPASYALATVERSHTGYDPMAGPAPDPSRSGPSRPRVGLASADTQARVGAGAAGFASSLGLLTTYLQAHRRRARFLVAATDGKTADPIALATGQPVITIGGFTGADPTPATGQIERLTASGELRYALLDATRELPSSPPRRAESVSAWVQRHCSHVPDAIIVASARRGSATPVSSISPALTLFACVARTADARISGGWAGRARAGR
jgi:4-amino-4-deoxy-L-arabinose transferase-like glycosyltransferase